MRNAVSRSRWASVDAENSVSSKISRSGRNEIVVPLSFVSPVTSTSPWATPRANS